jgi:PHD/YefM family antitoxin component YafN of YafNO toxin-antitoxin module
MVLPLIFCGYGSEHIKAKYLIDEKGNKKAVVMDIQDYQSLMEFIEDLEDSHDLLKAEKKRLSLLLTKSSARSG